MNRSSTNQSKSLLLVMALVLASLGLAHAQGYPNKPIRMVVPYPPGGVSDVATRLIAPRMSETLGQPIIIENLPAAGGVVATNALARSAPDGYSLGVMFESFATTRFCTKASRTIR